MQSEKRRLVIDIARRHQRPGSGSAPSFLAQRTTRMAWTDLTPTLSPLLWTVVGAAATRLYMPERVTQDLDVAVRAEDASRAREKLANAGFVYQGELSIGGSTPQKDAGRSAWISPDGKMIDVIEGHERWWVEALTEGQANRDAQGLPILPLHYLVLMKFQSGRVQDIADITRMLGQADQAALEPVRALFKRFAPSDLPDLESLITLGRLEINDRE
jgi:hypothetical protein